MTIARRELVDVSVTPWYHCITRCVRRALLLGEGLLDRKQWVEDRIEELAKIFAVGVGGFSVMDNHLHLLVRLDPEIAKDWSDDEVVRRWGTSLSASRQVAKTAAGFRRMGSGPAQGCPLGGEDSRATEKHQLVHEVPEGTDFTAGEPRG